jgi:RHS repeat-associated protein
LPNSIIGTYGYDNANQLTSITYMNGATTVGTLGYGYDLGGRQTSMTGTLAGFVPPTAVPSLTYDGTNRLTSWGGKSISYDANGNITNFGTATYTWNARNQLIATSNGSATFAYDALGRRISSIVNGITTPYLYDGQNPAMISSSQMLAGAGIDQIYAQVTSSGTTSYLRDGLNSTVALTNSSAATVANYSYSPYGDSFGSGATTPLQYSGRENDGATGLYYYRARFYSPQLGRFLSEDPIGLRGGTNYYAYVNGNPISYRDSSGKDPFLAVVGVGLGAAFGFINGVIAGDSTAELATDTLAGAASGGVIGLTDGLSLLGGIGLSAAANIEIEALRQLDNSMITHCDKIDIRGIAFAGATSVFGDLVGGASTLVRAEVASVANHAIFQPEEYENLAKIISTVVSGIATMPYSAISRLRH